MTQKLRFPYKSWLARLKRSHKPDETELLRDEFKTTIAQATINNNEIRNDFHRIRNGVDIDREPHSRTVMYQLQEYSQVMNRMMDTVVNMAERVFALVDKTMDHKDKQLFEQRSASRRWFWIAMSLAATLFYFFFTYWIQGQFGIDIPII